MSPLTLSRLPPLPWSLPLPWPPPLSLPLLRLLVVPLWRPPPLGLSLPTQWLLSQPQLRPPKLLLSLRLSLPVPLSRTLSRWAASVAPAAALDAATADNFNAAGARHLARPPPRLISLLLSRCTVVAAAIALLLPLSRPLPLPPGLLALRLVSSPQPLRQS